MQIVGTYPKCSIYMQGTGDRRRVVARVRLRNGKRHSRSFTGYSTLEEAVPAALEWYKSQPWGTGLGFVGDRLGDVLESYLASLAVQGRSASTLTTYRSCLRAYVAPRLGGMRIEDVKPHVVEAFYADLLRDGRADGTGLDMATVCKVHGFLRGAFEWCVERGALASNPVAKVTPKRPHREARSLMPADAERLERALSDELAKPVSSRADIKRENTALGAYLALHTGMRCGEICALTYGDLRQEDIGLQIRVAHTAVAVRGRGAVRQDKPKTKASERSVTAGAAVEHALSAHREKLDRVQGLAPSNGATPICAIGGSFMPPGTMSHMFGKMRCEWGLPDWCTFHTLRHTHATLLITNGIDMRTVQERLGHSRAETTLDKYGHVLPGRDAAAADAFDAIMKGDGRG